jgi:cell division protein DivIC
MKSLSFRSGPLNIVTETSFPPETSIIQNQEDTLRYNGDTMRKKRLRFKYKNMMMSLLFTVGGIILLIPVINEVLTTIELNNTLTEVRAQLSALEVENQQLQDQVNKLSDEDYIISYARGVYMLSKDGEKIYSIVDENGD